MALELTPEERHLAADPARPDLALALRLLAEMAELLGARRLIPIASAHIDGALYHGDGGVEFAERLSLGGGAVAVPTTLNVGILDPFHPHRGRLDPHRREMGRRMVAAYEAMGCRPTWTCAPYQAGHRPAAGTDVAWGESNAVVFCNSVLGARTNRYGDFLDICCALTGRAPETGLHLPERRRATVAVELDRLDPGLLRTEILYPVLGAWLGRAVGGDVAAIVGLPEDSSEDRLKALGAAAAATGEVGLFHVVGVTPEAPSLAAAGGGEPPARTVRPTGADLRAEADRMTTARGDALGAVALGSPHFSLDEFAALESALGGRSTRIPIYACTGRHVHRELVARGRLDELERLGVRVVVDTCVVVSPILPEPDGALMTNSGKFAHYGPAQTGYDTVFGSLEDCVRSALEGRVVRDEALWR
ncbi:MAG: aconitase X catalytic domain-containing protein [Gemmatimonadales bacterium]